MTTYQKTFEPVLHVTTVSLPGDNFSFYKFESKEIRRNTQVRLIRFLQRFASECDRKYDKKFKTELCWMYWYKLVQWRILQFLQSAK